MNRKTHLFYLFPFFLIIYEFCTNMSNDMYLPALPAISHDFKASINIVQLTITAWLAGNTSVQLIIGPLADRFGRRPILLWGGILFLLSTLGCAAASSIFLFILFRLIQGISVCTMMVAGYASIHDLYEDQKAIHILAWMGSAAVIAPAVGPVLGGLLLLLGNWRITFYSLFFLGIVSLIGLWFSMPEISITERKSLKVKSLISSYKKIICNLPFITSALSFALVYGGVIGWITASPFLLMEFLGITPVQFGWLQVPVFGAYIIGAQLVKPLMKKIGKERLISLGLTISLFGGFCFIIFSFIAPTHILSYILPMVGYTMGFGLSAAPLNRTTLTASLEQKGASIAIFYLTMTGMGTLTSLILSLFNETVISTSLIIAVSILVSTFLNRMRRKHEAV